MIEFLDHEFKSKRKMTKHEKRVEEMARRPVNPEGNGTLTLSDAVIATGLQAACMIVPVFAFIFLDGEHTGWLKSMREWVGEYPTIFWAIVIAMVGLPVFGVTMMEVKEDKDNATSEPYYTACGLLLVSLVILPFAISYESIIWMVLSGCLALFCMFGLIVLSYNESKDKTTDGSAALALFPSQFVANILYGTVVCLIHFAIAFMVAKAAAKVATKILDD